LLRAFGILIEQAARKEISTEDLQKQASELDVDLGGVVAQAIHSRWGSTPRVNVWSHSLLRSSPILKPDRQRDF
jgi:hypothetical protein